MQGVKGGARVFVRTASVVAGFLVLSAHAAPAATYYVRISGSDDNDGLTPQAAFATIRYAGRQLRAAGDQVIVGPGTYAEGNIEPFGSGNRDTPIVFEADTSGLRTGDPAGPVIIRPPNTEDATTGFIVFGKHDLRITGFTIDGAEDAGIQVRANFSTGVDSTRVLVDDNTITNVAQRGIDIVAAGDVEIAGNTVSRNRISGISLRSGQSATRLRPHVHDNLCELNDVGIAAEQISGGTIEDNIIHSSRRGLGMVSGAQMIIRRNEIRGSIEAMAISGTDLDFSANVIESGTNGSDISMDSGTFTGNRFVADGGFTDLKLIGSGTIRLVDNDLPRAIFGGRPALEARRNTGLTFTSTGSSIVASDNRWTLIAEFLASEEALVVDNDVGDLSVTGDRATVERNESRTTRIEGKTVGVFDNRMASLFLARQKVPADAEPDAGGSFHVERNTVAGNVAVGQGRQARRSSVSTATVLDNEIGGALFVIASDDIVVGDNTTGGIFCELFTLASRATITDNSARGHRQVGILVRGARSGVITGNQSSQNGSSGLAVRRSTNLKIADNVVFANQRGGLSIDIGTAVVGDCDNNGQVTVDEIIRAVDIVLGRRRLRDCLAIDANGDEIATVDEVILAVDAALGLGNPEGPEGPGGEVVIESNRVEDNALYGIDVFTAGPVALGANRVLRNGGIGIAAQLSGPNQAVRIVGNLIGSSQAEGIFLGGTAAADARDNVIFSNGDVGILLRDAHGVSVVNNLIYENANDGIAVGVGSPLPSPDALVMNNTLYANHGWGVTIGTASAASPGTMILNNIIDGNLRGGIAAQALSVSGLEIGFNLNNDGYGHDVAPSVTDFQAAPRFVDPFGADGVLGDHGFADDDFRLRPDSAAIDAGSATARQLGVSGSAIEGVDGDDGIVDLGFHYGAEAAAAP